MRGPPSDHVFKGGESTGVNRVPESLEGGRINQADPILQNALGVGARLVRIARFVAVGRVRRNGNQRFSGRRLEAEGEGPSDPRIGPPCSGAMSFPTARLESWAEATAALPKTAPPASAAPTWPRNLRRLERPLTALLAEGFPVSVTLAAAIFLVHCSLLYWPSGRDCVTHLFPRPVNYKKTVSMLRFRWLLLCKNWHRRWHCGLRSGFELDRRDFARHVAPEEILVIVLHAADL